MNHDLSEQKQQEPVVEAPVEAKETEKIELELTKDDWKTIRFALYRLETNDHAAQLAKKITEKIGVE